MNNDERKTHSVNDYYPDPDRDFGDPRTSDSNIDDPNMEDDSSGSANDDSGNDSLSGESPVSDNNGWIHFESGEDKVPSEPSGEYREDSSDNSSEDDGTMITCPNCHNEVPSRANFCHICGYHFNKEKETSFPLKDERIDGYLIDDIVSFTGPNSQTYLRKFRKVSEGGISFNWAAAILSNRWMAYRGMFRQAFMFSLAVNAMSGVISFLILYMFQSTGVSISTTTSNQISMFSIFLTIAIGLIAGLLGDKMYWGFAKKRMDMVNCKDRPAMSNSKISAFLKRAGAIKFSYVILIILFDYTLNDAIVNILDYIFKLS